MPSCFLATDLHGHLDRYEKLLAAMTSERPDAVFLGGDLLPRFLGGQSNYPDFVHDFMQPSFDRVHAALGPEYPKIYLILGNDDPRCEEKSFESASVRHLWHYIHQRKTVLSGFEIYGYACVPPTPFLLKDWERYDVSRYVPPGSLSPEEGRRSMPAEESRIRWGTIKADLDSLAGNDPVERAIFLLHTPPYDTALDRAALDGRMYEQVQLDVHIGSIAVRRFIEERQPLLTLHGHVHESTRLTGEWKIRIGKTICINGAHDGPELSLVRFDLESPWDATRELI